MSPYSLLVVLAVACGFGCSTLETSNDRVNPDKPLWFHRPAGAMQVLFMRNVSAESRSVGEVYERGRAAIDVFRGRVFVGTSDHGLYALRAASGSTIWRFETLGAVHSEPLYDSALDTVYFGSNDGALYALRASDGSLVWRFDTGAEIARKVVLQGEVLYFANAADNLFAIDRRTARRIWQVHRTPALGMEISGHAGPAFDGGAVFFAFSDGHVGAYDARDGSERWAPVDLSAEAEQTQGGAEALRYLDVDTTPIPADLGPQGHVVFVASYAGGVYALDQEHGVPVWKNEKAAGITDLALWREREHAPKPGSPLYVPGGPPVAAREILFASSGESGLWALDPASGKAIWRLPIPEGGITAPVPIAGALLVGTTRYGAFLLSPLDGRPIDGIDLGSGFSQIPAAFGNRAYLLSNAGTLLGLEIDSPVTGSGSDR
jgi:outer membrane protein assembly factor BamB